MKTNLNTVRIVKAAQKERWRGMPIAELIKYKRDLMNKGDYWLAGRVALIIIERRYKENER